MTTIRSEIMLAIKSKLEAISIANGYSADIPGGVYLHDQDGASLNEVPAITLSARESKALGSVRGSHSTYSVTLDVDVSLWVIDTDSITPSELLVDEIMADVHEALLESDLVISGQTIGPIEVNTVENFPLEEGQPFVGSTMSLSIQYRHRSDSPRVLV